MDERVEQQVFGREPWPPDGALPAEMGRKISRRDAVRLPVHEGLQPLVMRAHPAQAQALSLARPAPARLRQDSVGQAVERPSAAENFTILGDAAAASEALAAITITAVLDDIGMAAIGAPAVTAARAS